MISSRSKNIPKLSYDFRIVFLFSHQVMSDSATPWTAPFQTSLSFTISKSLLKFMSMESVMLFKHLIFCCHLFLLLSIFPNIRVFSSDLTLHTRRPKYWSFNFSISPSNEYSGLISYRIDWSDLGVPGTLKGLLQHHSSKTSILRCSAFLIIPYMTTGKKKKQL